MFLRPGPTHGSLHTWQTPGTDNNAYRMSSQIKLFNMIMMMAINWIYNFKYPLFYWSFIQFSSKALSCSKKLSQSTLQLLIIIFWENIFQLLPWRQWCRSQLRQNWYICLRSQGRGEYTPSNIWQWGGLAYVIIPPMLWTVNNILTYLYKHSTQINRFCSKNGGFDSKILSKVSLKMQIWVSQA